MSTGAAGSTVEVGVVGVAGGEERLVAVGVVVLHPARRRARPSAVARGRATASPISSSCQIDDRGRRGRRSRTPARRRSAASSPGRSTAPILAAASSSSSTRKRVLAEPQDPVAGPTPAARSACASAVHPVVELGERQADVATGRRRRRRAASGWLRRCSRRTSPRVRPAEVGSSAAVFAHLTRASGDARE